MVHTKSVQRVSIDGGYLDLCFHIVQTVELSMAMPHFLFHFLGYFPFLESQMTKFRWWKSITRLIAIEWMSILVFPLRSTTNSCTVSPCDLWTFFFFFFLLKQVAGEIVFLWLLVTSLLFSLDNLHVSDKISVQEASVPFVYLVLCSARVFFRCLLYQIALILISWSSCLAT